jgi:hypothetical protein
MRISASFAPRHPRALARLAGPAVLSVVVLVLLSSAMPADGGDLGNGSYRPNPYDVDHNGRRLRAYPPSVRYSRHTCECRTYVDRVPEHLSQGRSSRQSCDCRSYDYGAPADAQHGRYGRHPYGHHSDGHGSSTYPPNGVYDRQPSGPSPYDKRVYENPPRRYDPYQDGFGAHRYADESNGAFHPMHFAASPLRPPAPVGPPRR